MAQVTAYVNETLQQGSRLRPYGEQKPAAVAPAARSCVPKSSQRTMKAMSLSADQSRGPLEAIAFNCSSPFAVALDSSLPLIG